MHKLHAAVFAGDEYPNEIDSFWKVYGSDESNVVDICLLREGHIYEELVCNK